MTVTARTNHSSKKANKKPNQQSQSDPTRHCRNIKIVPYVCPCRCHWVSLLVNDIPWHARFDVTYINSWLLHQITTKDPKRWLSKVTLFWCMFLILKLSDAYEKNLRVWDMLSVIYFVNFIKIFHTLRVSQLSIIS